MVRSLMMFEECSASRCALMMFEEFWASPCAVSWCLRSVGHHDALSHDV